MRKTVSAAAEHTLDAWLERVMKGQLHISELPLCVAAWFHAGEAYGRAARQHELDQLNHECDRLWAHAFLSKDERRERILQRLDEGLANATEEQWQQLEQDLKQLHTNHSAPASNPLAAQGVHNDHTRRREAA